MKPLFRIPWAGIQLSVLLWLAILLLIAAVRVQRDGTVVSLPAVPLSFSEQRDTLVSQEARRAGVSVALAIAVSHVENWTGDSMAVSARGAVGLMQVVPKYWQHEFEEECGCGSLFQRRLNVCKGVRVLAFYLKQQKTTVLALRAYHGSLALHTAGDTYVALVLDQLVRPVTTQAPVEPPQQKEKTVL
jgi:soluble lytic murein transglycosylase-like protein